MRQAAAVVMILTLLLTLTACATTGAAGSGLAENTHPLKSWLQNNKKAKTRAILGAGFGAVLGAAGAHALGRDPVKGAVLGAAVGGLTGFLSGRWHDKRYGSRDEAIARLDYEPTQGYVLEIDDVRFEPGQLKPGEEAQVFVRYLVVGPKPDEDIRVQVSTGIKYDGEYVWGKEPEELVVKHGGGIIEISTALTIPKKAPAGTYSVEALFEESAGRFQDSREKALYVT